MLGIGGKYGTMDPAHMRMIATKVQRSNSLICPQGNRMSMYDDQQNYFKSLLPFLKAVDAGTVKPGAEL